MENSGGWKTYRKFGEKPLPKNVFGPPTYDTFSPPLCWRLSVISLKRKRHRPDQPQFLRPPKVVFGEHTLQYVLHTPNSRDTFCPPSAAAQLAKGVCRTKFWAKFPFLEGGSSGRSFREVCHESFSRSFRPCFAGTFRAKKRLQQNFSPKFT